MAQQAYVNIQRKGFGSHSAILPTSYNTSFISQPFSWAGSGGFGGAAYGRVCGGGNGGFGSPSLYNLDGSQRISIVSGASSYGSGDGCGGGYGLVGAGFDGGRGFPVSPPGGIPQVTANQHLWAPLNMEIDPNMPNMPPQRVRTDEWEQIMAPNTTLATFINQRGPFRGLKPLLEAWNLCKNRTKLELLGVIERNEGELNMHSVAEKELAMLEEDVAPALINNVELPTLWQEINFLRKLYEKDSIAAQTLVAYTSVIIMDNNNIILDYSTA